MGSLCSPRRSDQARDALRCMHAGKHVYAEKPCAFTESELDVIIATSRETGMQFHEMAGAVVDPVYAAMRAAIVDGGQVRLLETGQSPRTLACPEQARDYFDLYVDSLRGEATMPLSLEHELSPTRWVIRARGEM